MLEAEMGDGGGRGPKGKKSAPRDDATADYAAGEEGDLEDIAEEMDGSSASAPGGVFRTKPVRRKLYYEAELALEAADPKAVVTQITAYANKAGGYVEGLNGTKLVVRLPGQTFLTDYAAIQKMATVLDKSLRVDDITDVYADLAQRRTIMLETLRRYEALLAVAPNAAEKLAILAEIARLRERLAFLETGLAEVEKLAKFSRLAVDVRPRVNEVKALSLGRIGAFEWIERLDPLGFAVASSGKKLAMKAPKNFVAVEDRDFWLAESSTKARVWSTRLENNPRGDAAFWQAALYNHLSKLNETKVKKYSAGSFKGVRLVPALQDPYVYTVAVKVAGDEIFVVESLFPSVTDEKANGKAVSALLTGWKGN